jgi:nucleoside-diphosphate-sugar epimerase
LARALIIGCGCRGRELGGRLLAEGWAVRGTSRREGGLAAIEAAGIEAALAEPDRVGTVLELVGDVAVVFHLLGSAAGAPEALAELHGPRLERLLERVVDTPVRGVVYEATGSVEAAVLAAGAELVETASRTWRIPAQIVTVAADDQGDWAAQMANLALGLLSPAHGLK